MPNLGMGIEDFGAMDLLKKFLGKKSSDVAPPDSTGMGAIPISGNPDFWKSDPKDTSKDVSPSVANRSSGAIDPTVASPVAPDPSASQSGEGAGVGGMDFTKMMDPKDKGIVTPDRQPTVAPPAGSGKGESKSDFTQQDPKTGQPAAPATDEDTDMLKKLEAEQARMPDPSAQATKDMGPRPVQHDIGGMKWMAPLLGGILGGAYGFEGVSGGLKEGTERELKTTQDFDKRLTELTADYRKEQDVNKRAIMADQIKVLRDKQQAKIAERKAQATEDRNRITSKHNDDTARLGQLRIDTTGNIGSMRILAEQAWRQAELTGKDEDRAIADRREADYHSLITEQILHMGRDDKVKEGLLAVAQKRVTAVQAKELGAVLGRHYDAMGSQIERLQGDLAITRDKDAKDRINKMIDDLKKEREGLHGEMEKVNLYKEPAQGLGGAGLPELKDSQGQSIPAAGHEKFHMRSGGQWYVSDGTAWKLDPTFKK